MWWKGYRNGGGAYADDGSFTMKDNATISGNTASGNTASYTSGGGVRLNEASTFTKTGGIIYGSNETNPALRNVVKDSAGVEQTDKDAAIYGDPTHRRETTVTAAQNLSKTSDGTYTGQWSD